MDSRTFELPVVARRAIAGLGADDVGAWVQLSGWVHRRRDHGGLDLHRLARPPDERIAQMPPDPIVRNLVQLVDRSRRRQRFARSGVPDRGDAAQRRRRARHRRSSCTVRRGRRTRTSRPARSTSTCTGSRSSHARRPRRSSSTPRKSRRRTCGCASAISICGGRGCSATCACATASSRRCATGTTSTASSRSRRRT